MSAQPHSMEKAWLARVWLQLPGPPRAATRASSPCHVSTAAVPSSPAHAATRLAGPGLSTNQR